MDFFLLLLCVLGNQLMPSTQQDIIPQHYDLTIVTNPTDESFPLDNRIWGKYTVPKKSFCGEIVITVLCVTATDTILLDFKNLENPVDLKVRMNDLRGSIFSVELKDSGIVDDKHLKITTVNNLQSNTAYRISLKYKSQLQTDFQGYYISHFKYGTNVKNYAATRFSAGPEKQKSHVFPCFDNSNFTTTFKISHMFRIGFQPVSSSLDKVTANNLYNSETWYVVRTETEKMPLNQFGLMLLTWRCEPIEKKLLAVLARKVTNHLASFAAEEGSKYLQLYRSYFPNERNAIKNLMIRLVVIPGLYKESKQSRGLTSYRETSILTTNITSEIKKKQISSTLAYDMAYQWLLPYFSEYMNEPNCKWLMEGIATYVAQFVNRDGTNEIYGRSTLETLLSVRYKMDFNERVKGFYIVRMALLKLERDIQINPHLNIGDKNSLCYLNEFMGQLRENKLELLPEFSKILATYTFMESWNEKQAQDYLKSWSGNNGFPLLRVIRSPDSKFFTVQQEPYFATSKSNHWYIPLIYTTTKLNNSLIFWDLKSKEFFEVTDGTKRSSEYIINDVLKNDEAIIFNPNLEGMYKVMYDSNNWRLIINTLESRNYININELSRAQLVADILDFAWYGRKMNKDRSAISYNEHVLPLGRYLRDNEREYFPWLAALTRLNQIENVLRGDIRHAEFIIRMKNLLGPILQLINLQLQEERTFTMDEMKFQALIYENAVLYMIKIEIADLQKFIFQHPHLRRAIWCQQVKSVSGQWLYMKQMYYSRQFGSEETEDYIFALGCATNEDDIYYSVKPGVVDPADEFDLFKSMASRLIPNKYMFDELMKEVNDDLGGSSDAKRNLYDRLEYFADYVTADNWKNWTKTVANKWCKHVDKDLCGRLKLPIDEKIAWKEKHENLQIKDILPKKKKSRKNRQN